ncbi:MAG TPA: hypothetical protein VIR03_00750 [Candidatus Saccharimonadales bacterium]
MSKTPPSSAKKAVKEPRQLKAGKYRSFRLQKTIKTGESTIPGVFKLMRGALGVLVKNWKVFGGVILIYCVLNLLLVQSFNGTNGGNSLDQTKANLESMNSGPFSSILSSAALFVYMASSSGNVNSTTAGAYQLMLTVITSLVLIWVLREVYAGKKVRVRDGFYWGMYPLVPFILVVGLALVQLFPVILGGYMYNMVTQGIAASGPEMALWVVLFALLALLSMFMLAATLFAIYIVCLPNVTPMVAIHSAQELVRYRRWTVIRKVLFLPVFLLIVAALVIVPLIFFAPVVANVTFLFTTVIGLPVIHSYMYRLYRELL